MKYIKNNYYPWSGISDFTFTCTLSMPHIALRLTYVIKLVSPDAKLR